MLVLCWCVSFVFSFLLELYFFCVACVFACCKLFSNELSGCWNKWARVFLSCRYDSSILSLSLSHSAPSLYVLFCEKKIVVLNFFVSLYE
eukprot:m.139025 g.139025  ORF g.139025 m.139025 type:complete len:90 (+) comp18515_c0_seq1:323-592(+)